MPVARNDLGGNRLGCETQFFAHVGFDRWIDVGKGADRAGNRAGADFGPRRHQPFAVAREFSIMAGKFHAKGGGLRMDRVAATDTGRIFVLHCPALERVE